MANMVFRRMGELFVVLHSQESPTDQEWATYVGAWSAAGKEPGGSLANIRHLIFTDEGGPTAKQRNDGNRALEGHEMRAAVVTRSTMVRGIVTALSWFNKGVRAFPPEEMPAAFQHLGVSQTKIARVMVEARTLRAELGGNALKGIL